MAEATLTAYILASLRQSNNGANARAISATSVAAADLGLLGAAPLQGPHGDGIAEFTRKAQSLAASKTHPTKQTGLALLAIVSAECGRATFLRGCSEWVGEAAAALKPAEGQHPEELWRSAWQLLAAVFTRIGRLLEVPGVRRDGAALAPRLATLLAQHAQRAGAPTPDALRALLAALTALPASFRQHVKALEPILAGALLGTAGQGGVSRRLAAACLAALPRAAGDADSWSAAAQRLLATAHALLDTAYLGHDDPSLLANCRHQLDPQAASLLPLAHSAAAATSSSVDAYAAVFPQLDGVLSCLELLLTRSYPSPVPLPTAALLLLASRILAIDDAHSTGRLAASGGKVTQLCLHLPALHCAALRLLRTLLRAAGAQMTPLYAAAARLAGEHLGRAAAGGAGALVPASAAVRTALYCTAAALLQVGGMALARQLAPVVLQCTDTELYGQKQGAGDVAAAAAPAAAAAASNGPARKRHKRARHSAADDAAAAELLAGAGNDNLGALSSDREVRAQAALLGLLEALLVAGAALLAPAERLRIDAVAAHAAVTTAAAAQRLGQAAEGDAGGVKVLQVAAYRTLLASVLPPLAHRPPHLPTALRLFRQGLRDPFEPLATFCSHALLSCEALLHPRAVPRPAPLRQPADGAPTLGMPHFWTPFDADVALRQQQLRQQELQLQFEQQAAAAAKADVVARDPAVTEVAPAAAQALVPVAETPAAPAPLPQQLDQRVAEDNPPTEPQQREQPSGMPAPLAGHAAAPPALPVPQVAPAELAVPAPNRFDPMEESDSEGSLPEIDSGASSSGSSDSEPDGDEA